MRGKLLALKHKGGTFPNEGAQSSRRVEPHVRMDGCHIARWVKVSPHNYRGGGERGCHLSLGRCTPNSPQVLLTTSEVEWNEDKSTTCPTCFLKNKKWINSLFWGNIWILWVKINYFAWEVGTRVKEVFWVGKYYAPRCLKPPSTTY